MGRKESNQINRFVGSRTASVNMDGQWCKQEACFACKTQVSLTVNHNISVTSGIYVYESTNNPVETLLYKVEDSTYSNRLQELTASVPS